MKDLEDDNAPELSDGQPGEDKESAILLYRMD
jgi:hypothetical protein